VNNKHISLQHNYGSKTFEYGRRSYIMGVLNVTPDSFSDGGRFHAPDAAVEHALAMIEDGADIIDIGGESTRPGSERISAGTELNRVIPVIEKILEHQSNAILSIDTYKSQVADEALQRGALIVNDISALRYDEQMPGVIQRHNATIILMHMKDDPQTMQDAPYYLDVTSEVYSFLNDRAAFAEQNNIKQIIVDPGIGFGKRVQDNLELLRSLNKLKGMGHPVLVGASRKSFIGKILDVDIDLRLEGSIAAAVIGIMNGASIVRVHDIAATKRAVTITDAIMTGSNYQKAETGHR